MTVRMIFAASTLCALLASPVFAQDGSVGASPSKVSIQAQAELLPLGTATGKIGDFETSADTEVAYGISAAAEFAVTPFLGVGVAPRLIFNVKTDEESDDTADKELDLRARIRAHFAMSPGLEVFAALSPGYTFVLSSEENVDSAKGFAIGGSAGVTYDVAANTFVGGEVGYQRAFTSSSITVLGMTADVDVDVSYLHVGIGAGMRF